MSDCGVCIGGDYGYCPAEFFDVLWPKARKAHTCSECNRIIERGDTYQRCNGKSDGEFWSFITCAVCAEIREAFSCEGESLGGMMWEEMQDYAFPSLNESCFDKLQTVEAKKYLRECWMEWKGLKP